ncbi:MAG: hypothetical protein R3F65_05225 [bacterium]
MRATPALALLATLTLTGCLIEPETARCTGATTCSACIEESGCGWCPGNGCVAATSLGPDDDTLTCGDGFRWSRCGAAADDDDGRLATCETCIDAGRAWCQRVGAGGACIGRDDPCATFSWIATCPSTPWTCGSYSTCRSCAADDNCEWISESGGADFVSCDASDCAVSPGFGVGCQPRSNCR